MAKYNDPAYIGKKYNMLTVLGATLHTYKNGTTAWFWHVRCDCGNENDMRPIEIIKGKIVSCGCYRKSGKQVEKRCLVHGESHTRLHNIWCGINKRCDPTHANMRNYSKNNISMCEEWRDYTKFAEWARTNGYQEDLSIERINVMGDYCPDNCTWISMEKQARNRTTTRWVEYQGRRMSLAEAAEITGLPYKQVHARLKSGWSLEDALTKPLRIR